MKKLIIATILIISNVVIKGVETKVTPGQRIYETGIRLGPEGARIFKNLPTAEEKSTGEVRECPDKIVECFPTREKKKSCGILRLGTNLTSTDKNKNECSEDQANTKIKCLNLCTERFGKQEYDISWQYEPKEGYFGKLKEIFTKTPGPDGKCQDVPILCYAGLDSIETECGETVADYSLSGTKIKECQFSPEDVQKKCNDVCKRFYGKPIPALRFTPKPYRPFEIVDAIYGNSQTWADITNYLKMITSGQGIAWPGGPSSTARLLGLHNPEYPTPGVKQMLITYKTTDKEAWKQGQTVYGKENTINIFQDQNINIPSDTEAVYEIDSAIYGGTEKNQQFDVTEFFKRSFLGKPFGVIFKNDQHQPDMAFAFGGDPAPGIAKKLTIRYKDPKDNQIKTAIFNDNERVVIPFTGSVDQRIRFEVTNAIYGANNKYNEVTQYFKDFSRKIPNWSDILKPDMNKLFGDPIPNIKKELIIDYKDLIRNKTGSKIFTENADINMSLFDINWEMLGENEFYVLNATKNKATLKIDYNGCEPYYIDISAQENKNIGKLRPCSINKISVDSGKMHSEINSPQTKGYHGIIFNEGIIIEKN